MVLFKKEGKKMIEGNYVALTWDELLVLKNHCLAIKNDGTVGNVKINGKVRTWKRDASRIEIPCKYGLYEYHTFTAEDCHRLIKEIVK
jgi:hypothetical protein